MLQKRYFSAAGQRNCAMTTTVMTTMAFDTSGCRKKIESTEIFAIIIAPKTIACYGQIFADVIVYIFPH